MYNVQHLLALLSLELSAQLEKRYQQFQVKALSLCLMLSYLTSVIIMGIQHSVTLILVIGYLY